MSGFEPSIQIVRHNSERLLPSRAFVEMIRAVLAKGADFRLRAKGMSMHPFIQDGDLVTVRATRPEKLRVGQVVALPHPERGNLIIHRIVGARHHWLKIKGDFNPASDGWIERNDVLGKIVRVERNQRPVRSAHCVVKLGIVWLSRFSRLRRFRLRLYKTMLLRGELY